MHAERCTSCFNLALQLQVALNVNGFVWLANAGDEGLAFCLEARKLGPETRYAPSCKQAPDHARTPSNMSDVFGSRSSPAAPASTH